jgi:electron transfer flavoprotein alpha subunit
LDIQDLNYRKNNYKNLLLQTRPAFGGNIIATIISPDARPQMATVREGVMAIAAPDINRRGTVIDEDFIPSEQDACIQVLERVQNNNGLNLKDSNIIVAVGGGVTNQESLKLVQQLAHTLSAQLGATRVAVERGLISRDHQVGQTGITVRPQLYIACGVSGAIQHRTGMDQSTMIVAFNKDPNAAIMKIADFAVVGDLKQTIPMFLEAYQRKMNH